MPEVMSRTCALVNLPKINPELRLSNRLCKFIAPRNAVWIRILSPFGNNIFLSWSPGGKWERNQHCVGPVLHSDQTLKDGFYNISLWLKILLHRNVPSMASPLQCDLSDPIGYPKTAALGRQCPYGPMLTLLPVHTMLPGPVWVSSHLVQPGTASLSIYHIPLYILLAFLEILLLEDAQSCFP